ncbi:hypothetical protein LIER_10533 [Lithospermum erythrorhizon]|uniref:Uncharacterized protein n=1 Tax=Lithospermum erythrorhizon TaxID=34254 RepID=A0AAV3PNN8_LITER
MEFWIGGSQKRPCDKEGQSEALGGSPITRQQSQNLCQYFVTPLHLPLSASASPPPGLSLPFLPTKMELHSSSLSLHNKISHYQIQSAHT